MTDGRADKRPKAWLLNGVLALMGVGMAGGMVALTLALFPALRPDTITFTVAMGDIFYNHPEWVARPDNPNEVLSVHRLAWDADGFRVPAWQADHYPVIVLGDSFTEAANVGMPWPDVLAREISQPVRNLAFRGYGPVEQAAILDLYGASAGADVVILGFFEGNDLSNAISADPDNIPLPSDVTEFQIIATDPNTVQVTEERYPMPVLIGGQTHDIAFFEWYVWNLNGEPETYAESMALEISAEYWRQMRDRVPSACFVIAYFPSKPHVYVPYLTEPARTSLMSKAFELRLTRDRQFRNEPQPGQDFSLLVNRLGNLRDAVQAQAVAEGIPFFDVTPLLQEAAHNGAMLYYTYDTHWNQAGHDLVGRAIAEYLQTNPCGRTDGG